MMPDQGSPSQDLRSILRTIWRWKLLVLVLVLAPPAAAYLVKRNDPKIYQSSALVSLTATPGASGGAAPQSSAVTAARIVKTSSVARIAARQLQPRGNPGALAGAVSTSVDTDTDFITITATDQDPRRAAAIAMAFAAALSIHQQGAVATSIDTRIASLREELKTIGRRDPMRADVFRELNQLQGQRGTLGPGATVIEPATASGSPVGPNVRRDVEIALVIGILLAIGAVLAAESGNRRVRLPEELEELTGLSLLSAIPRSAFRPRPRRRPEEDEAFQMLRASLTYFHVGRPIEVVVVTSAGQQDGKTTVATRLALAAAAAGKRAVLVDADLRRPRIGAQLGLEAPAAGLGAVLAGETSLARAVVAVPVEEHGAGRLLVLPAGPVPPNPTELLGSQQMEQLLRQVARDADLVVVDTPAALAVSDAVPLFRIASGVILVARMNQSRRDEVKRLQRVIESAQGKLLGVVATGTTDIGGYGGYGYGYGYYGGERPRRRFRRRRAGRGAAVAPPVPGAPEPAAEPSAPVGEAGANGTGPPVPDPTRSPGP